MSRFPNGVKLVKVEPDRRACEASRYTVVWCGQTLGVVVRQVVLLRPCRWFAYTADGTRTGRVDGYAYRYPAVLELTKGLHDD